MKQFCVFFFLIMSLHLYSQKDMQTDGGFYYKISLATTLTINEYYSFAEDDDTGPLILPSAFFINNTFGYKFDERSVIGLNIEYNWHSESGLHFLPAYLSFRYNFIVDDDNVFVRSGYGRLLNLGNAFESGTVYKVGAGAEIFNENYTNSFLIGLDFYRKRFGYKQLDKLSSVSIFFEFILF